MCIPNTSRRSRSVRHGTNNVQHFCLEVTSETDGDETSILQDSCLMDRALHQAFHVLVRDPAGRLRLPSSPQLALPLTRKVYRRLSANLTPSLHTTARSFSHGQGPAYQTSNPVTAMSYTSNGTQFGPSATPAYAQSPTSMGYRTGGRHRRSQTGIVNAQRLRMRLLIWERLHEL